MVRFIFVCMVVVALSAIAIATQPIMDGVSDETANVAARNAEEPAAQNVALETAPEAENLNAIESTAGGNNPDDTFKGGFTNEAPKALDDSAQMPAGTTAMSPDASRDIPVAGPPVAPQPASN